MGHRVLRTFHPIGQGAFYSERHDNFNIVYDCGAKPLSSYAKSLVQSVFTEVDDIDVLFISHFDYDHVSAISLLMRKVNKIKKVVLPLLHEGHKNLLININRAMSQDIVKLLSDPQSFFGKDTDIIYVKPSSEQEKSDNDDGTKQYDLGEIRHLKNLKTGKIEVMSGTKLKLGSQLNWVFVPYNFCNTSRSAQLENELRSEGINVTQLKSDPLYSLSAFSTPENRRALRKIYSRVDGNVNENSMLLYSGPETSIDDGIQFHCYDENYRPYYWSSRSGCIYTGDADLNQIDLGAEYSDYVEFVGVIQVPHHGSRHNFAIDAFWRFWPHIVCPISCGEKNQYGHPASEVINQLSIRHCIPYIITERPNTGFVQEIVFADKKTQSPKKLLGEIEDE